MNLTFYVWGHTKFNGEDFVVFRKRGEKKVMLVRDDLFIRFIGRMQDRAVFTYGFAP